MVSKHVRAYLALILIVAILSTAWTITSWIWRERTLRLLGIQGTDTLFSAAQGERILSITVAPERKIGRLEFRFRSLIEREPADVPLTITKINSSEEVLVECGPIADRLAYFSTLGADQYALIHEVNPTNLPGHRLIVVDFGRIYASFFDEKYQNESVTTFAFLVNTTDHLVGYFEGYSEYLAMRGVRGRLLTRKDLINMLRVEVGPTTTSYVPNAVGDQLLLADLPAWGQLAFEDTLTDMPYSFTMIVREGMIGLERILLITETFADGNWYEKASGYWLIRTARR
ncbi:MAG: hypothetical protein HXS50_04435 [Theionarchaea archaeon]|nr:hypothetical protein [Theionarchaea archaeon]